MTGLITGAGRGLGFELVKYGLELGHRIVAASKEQPAAGSELGKLKEEYSDRLTLLKMDVCSEDEVEKAAAILSERKTKLDFIINNAGVLFESKYDMRNPIEELDIEMLRKTIDVNAVGPAIVLKHFFKYIGGSESPCIINVTSEGAMLSPKGHHYPAYCISKSALNMYTQKIRNYLSGQDAAKKTRVFFVHPGRMQTVMGKENAQIHPREAAVGIYDIINGSVRIELEIPFIDYKGRNMLDKI